MIFTINILMLLLLSWIFYEDTKDRKVTLVVLLSLIVVGGYLNFQEQITMLFLLSLLINLGVVFIVVLLLFLYSKIKLKSSLFRVFGMGDLLFFIFMSVSFPTTTFLVLFSVSLIFSLMISLLFQKKFQNMVPLAGLQALFLILIIGANTLLNVVNLYEL